MLMAMATVRCVLLAVFFELAGGLMLLKSDVETFWRYDSLARKHGTTVCQVENALV